MFEKEAEEYSNNLLKDVNCNIGNPRARQINSIDVENAFQYGAEFGYNKAKEDADKMKSRFLELCNLKDMRIAQLENANKWHYMKDGINPTHSYRVLVFTDEGVGFGIYGLDDKKWHTYDTGFNVIAWKEIVLPNEEISEVEK